MANTPTPNEQQLEVMKLKCLVTSTLLDAGKEKLDPDQIYIALSNLEQLVIEANYWGAITEKARNVD